METLKRLPKTIVSVVVSDLDLHDPGDPVQPELSWVILPYLKLWMAQAFWQALYTQLKYKHFMNGKYYMAQKKKEKQ